MKNRGLSLIEMIIVILIGAVLFSIAYPMYSKAVLASKRSEAQAYLGALHLAQQRYRDNNPEYAPDEKLDTPASDRPPGLGMNRERGDYTFTIESADNVSYTLVAVASGSQLGDANCVFLTLTWDRTRLIKGGGPNGSTAEDEGNCWSK